MPGLLLTQTEAARYLGHSRLAVRRWTRRGILPVFVDPDSKRVMYPRPALDRWLVEQASSVGVGRTPPANHPDGLAS